MKIGAKPVVAGLGLAMAAFVSQPAAAQWYVSAHGGLNFQQSADNTGGTPATSSNSVTSHFDAGYSVGGALGHTFGPWRVEAELAYRRSDLNALTAKSGTISGLGIGGPATDLSGNESAFSVMGNLFYDFHLGGGVTPYVDAGLGVANVKFKLFHGGGVPAVNDTTAVFAYQAGAGVSYNVTPKTAFFVEYRFFGTANPDFYTSPTDGAGVVPFNSEYHRNAVSVGVRYNF